MFLFYLLIVFVSWRLKLVALALGAWSLELLQESPATLNVARRELFIRRDKIS